MLFLTTGGTVASSSGEEDLVPSLISKEILHYLNEYHGDVGIVCEDLLRLDSNNMQPEEWQLITRHIAEAKNGYGSVVLNHDIDTIMCTAGALSFMLRSLDVPLIITGSQLPLLHSLNDGVENICVAFTTVYKDIQGVYVYFSRKTMLAIRVVKVRTMNFDAFESMNIEPCGRVDARDLHIDRQLLIHPTNAFTLEDELCKEVMLIKLIPGMNPLLLDKLAEIDIRGIIIKAFDAGGIDFVRRDLVSRLEGIVTRGISAIVCSQCLYRYSDFSICQTGQKILQHGMIRGCGMTSEVCATKLMWALGKSTDTKEVRRIFETNHVNEITLP